VDLENRLLSYSAAGHPPLMLATSTDGTVREIEENGLMLGLFPEATYSSVEIRIASGDRCLLYTDGVFEATNTAREEFGNRAAKNSWNRIVISRPRILLMISLPASRHFPASASLTHRRTTSPCSSSISKRRVHKSSDKNSEANYVRALQP
jgi:sigma-B regulation protein RsbU (phosphoserine phosphatase)